MMRRYLYIICAFVIGMNGCLAQTNSSLNRMVQDIALSSAMKHGQFAVSVYNISKGNNICNHNAQMALTPASMCKIFTTGVGFEELGSNFRFKTSIGYTGEIDKSGVLHGNIIIVGGGDPLLGSYRYRQTCIDTLMHSWYKAITGYGIKSIEGRICVDGTIFDNQQLHDSWQHGDVGNYYGVGSCGLNFHENMYFAYFNAGKKLGYPAELVSTAPKNINITNRNEVTTGPDNSGDQVIVYGEPNSTQRLYRGTIPLNKKNFGIRCAMPNPALCCAEQFSSYLRSKGVHVSNSASDVGSHHDNIHTILDYYSNIYYVIAQYTNFTSNNMYAESIFKYLGYKLYGKGSFTNGSKAVMNYFKQHQLDCGGVKIVDGSGLSRLDRVSTGFTCSFLTAMSRSSNFEDFHKSLAKVGETGTVKKLVPGLPANIEMRVKSGSMEGVVTYAGYVTTASGDLVCFSIICNNFDGTASSLKQQLSKLLLKIGTL